MKRQPLAVVRRWLLPSALITLATVSGSLIVTLLTPPTYQASASVFLSVRSATSTADLAAGTSYATQIVQSYASVVESPYILQPVAQEVGGVSAAELSKGLSVSVPLDQTILQISVENRSSTVAARAVNAIASRLIDAAVELSPSAQASDAIVKITPLSQASPPTVPVGPHMTVNVLVGLIAGLVIASFFAIVGERLDQRLRSVDEVSSAIRSTVLGSIPSQPRLRDSSVLQVLHEEPPSSEAFRTLRANLQFSEVDAPIRSLAITSPTAGEGKSTTAIGLARAMAEAGRRTLLIDGDMRRPRIGPYLSLNDSVGLADVLVDAATLKEALQASARQDFWVLPAGRMPPNPSELLESNAFSSLVEDVVRMFDIVIFDSPPILAVADPLVLSRSVDAVVLVVSVGSTTVPQLNEAESAIMRAHSRMVGVVVNKVSRSDTKSHYYDYVY